MAALEAKRPAAGSPPAAPATSMSPNTKQSEINRAKAERLKDMLAAKYGKQKTETEELSRRRTELEEQMASMNLTDVQKKKYR